MLDKLIQHLDPDFARDPKGRVGGRKPGLSKENKIKALAAYNLHEKGEHKVSEILDLLKISKASFYRYIEYVKNDLGKKSKV